jgi:hypothetical protein
LFVAFGFATARPWFLPFKSKKVRLVTFFSKVRGGSTAAASQHLQHENLVNPYYRRPSSFASYFEEAPIYSQEQQSQALLDNPFQPPQIKVSQMALALRWTAEVNRMLQLGTKTAARPVRVEERLLPTHCPSSILDPLRGGGDIASTTTVTTQHVFRIPLKQQHLQESQQFAASSIFHAPSSRYNKSKTGVARWGPDLEQFLNRLVDVLNTDESEAAFSSSTLLELSLAMIYLDRACSVETVRDGGIAALPFCTPQTVHRLVLTAMLVSVSAARGLTSDRNSMSELYGIIERAFGIPALHCETMVEWMRQALGRPGIFVTPDQMQEWKTQWESRFSSTPPLRYSS